MRKHKYPVVPSTGNARLDVHLQAQANCNPVKTEEQNSTWLWMWEHRDALNNILVHQRDDFFDELGAKTMIDGYLLRVGFDKEIVERPQLLFLRVASALHHPNLSKVTKVYNEISTFVYMPASPTLFNAGLTFSQMSSCFLLKMQDNINSILWCMNAQGLISKANGAVGISYSSLRSGTSIGFNGVSNGVVQPELVSGKICEYINQGGHRDGASQNELAIWHIDIQRHIKLTEKDDPVNSLEKANTSIGTYDLFWERVNSDSRWSLFSPDQVPGLDTAFGDEFNRIYLEAEQKGLAGKSVLARDLRDSIAETLIRTGRPYVINLDAINKKTNMGNIGFISTLNLCQEIALPADEMRIPSCNLSATCLRNYVKKNSFGVLHFDFQQLASSVRQQVENLNAVIERNYHPLPEIEFSNKESLPIGIGMMGLNDVLQQLGINFDSKEASELIEKISACTYYNALFASSEIAREVGPYPAFKSSKFSQGIFQFDQWNVIPLEPSTWGQEGSWDFLRQKVMRDGVRNSQLTTQQPTGTISSISGNSEMTEPLHANVYTKRTKAGDFVMINQYLEHELTELDLWSEEMFNWIFHQDGSIKGLSEIWKSEFDFIQDQLEIIEKKYRIMSEYSQRIIIDQAALRAPYIDGSQSMNINIVNPSVRLVSDALSYSQKKGLKTICYYLRSNKPISAIKVVPKTRPVAKVCTRSDSDCKSCQ
jgi:ribonucleoside-diphosphate reductase alpha subunit